ncbi:MAG: alpha/beta hydrolase [Gammaproteobacteria bacterium]|nr:alpha/beta hydrolase [Gammaproteobacteria bacterium]
MKRDFRCSGSGGVRLAASEYGVAGAPALVFVHGFSQSRLCWKRQLCGDLARRFHLIAYDLRGHGLSDKPADLAGYASRRIWADDLRAMLEQSALARPVLIAWSFGVEVVRDYLHFHGDRGLAAIVFVAGRATPADVGPGLADEVAGLCSEDIEANIAATVRFVRNCSATPLAPADLIEFVAFNCMASLSARIGIRQRAAVPPDELAAVSVPVLIIHGDEDRIINPAATDRLATHLTDVRVERYAGCGHLPFIEQQQRFDADLVAFCDRVFEQQA